MKVLRVKRERPSEDSDDNDGDGGGHRHHSQFEGVPAKARRHSPDFDDAARFPMCAVGAEIGHHHQHVGDDDRLTSVLHKMASSDSEELLPPCKYSESVAELEESAHCLQKVKDERTGGGEHCFGCGDLICDRFLLRVNEHSWHSACLRCSVCQTALDRHPSCYIRDDLVYCKTDYGRTFGARCAKCARSINQTDWVRRARDQVYHLACFACEACKRQLSTGEEFALHQNQVLCKTHYLETVDGGNSSYDESGDGESGGSGQNGSGGSKAKTKRVRTTFTDEQLQVLQANFQLDSNPDGQDLERIAQITGLSKRVTQVWFQNSRARQKKHMHQINKTKPGGNGNNMTHVTQSMAMTNPSDYSMSDHGLRQDQPPLSVENTSEDTSSSGMTVIYSFG